MYRSLVYLLLLVFTLCRCSSSTTTERDQPTPERTNRIALSVPIEIKAVADSLGLECPPKAFAGCAACSYCGFVKLSSDWRVFGYEQDETKHSRSIKIYKRTLGKYELIQTLYGYVDSVLVAGTSSPYAMIIKEDTCSYANDNPCDFNADNFRTDTYTYKETQYELAK